jgi:putative Mn2+ efflux pump MntP
MPGVFVKEKISMSLFTLFVTAVGLSMDAFAVSICKGLAMKKLSWKKALIIGLWFGGFQALMPSVGYLLGTSFEKYVTAIDHWIAFALLCLIGANMIKEALSGEEEEANDSVDVKTMFLLAVATSIDALAVGITYAFLQVQIIPAVTFIGVTTFVLSVAGVKIGNVFGLKYKTKAEILGGIILILMGVKILLEHLFG